MRRTDVIVLICVLMLMMVASGCGNTLRCVYKEGDTETVSRESSLARKIWVEMPGKEPSTTGTNLALRKIVVQREVESVTGRRGGG